MYRGSNLKSEERRSNHSSDDSHRYHSHENTPPHSHHPPNYIMQGPPGPSGQRGCMGPEGPQGPQGPQGASILTGEGVPNRYQGQDGDSYVDTTTGTVYRKVMGQWVATTGNMVGPTGPTGPCCTGPTGPISTNVYGRMWIEQINNVTSVISSFWSILGANNWYFDADYQDTALVYDSNLMSHLIQVNVSGVYFIEATCQIVYDEINLYARIVEYPSFSGVIGTTTLVNIDETPIVHLTKIIRANAGTAYGLQVRSDSGGTAVINYASVSVFRLGF